MSNPALDWVFEYSTSKGVNRVVLLVIANRMNKDTGLARLGFDRIAKEANCAPGRVTKWGTENKSVRRAVKSLVASEELVIVEHGQAGRGHANVYTIPAALKGVTVTPFPDSTAEAKRGHPRTQKGSSAHVKGVTTTPEPSNPRTLPSPRVAAANGGSATATANLREVAPAHFSVGSGDIEEERRPACPRCGSRGRTGSWIESPDEPGRMMRCPDHNASASASPSNGKTP